MKIDNTNLNIPDVTVGETLDMLSLLYTNAVKANVKFRCLPTPFLWGPAGIGKSQAVFQLSDRLAEATGKVVTVTDVRLLLFSPVDLRGVPVADEHKKFSNWLMPRIFDMNVDERYINILFLDELSAAPQSVQAAAYQICLDRRIGEHKLPDNCIVIAAGNRTTDMSVSYKMPKALCNRLMHFNIQTNFDAWREWAITHNVDSRIIGYLAFDSSKLCVEPESSDMAYPTPRSWAFVNDLLRVVEGNIDGIHPLISACIGNDTALEFESWINVHNDLPEIKEVLSGHCSKYPKTYDALHALTASMVAAVRMRKDKISVSELENACTYVRKFPVDFAMTFYKDLTAIEEVNLKLMKCPSCQMWLSKNRQYL